MSEKLNSRHDVASKRLNIVLPERTVARINSVRQLTSASSVTDVLKTAVLTYEALAQSMAEGNKFYMKKDGDSQFTPVLFLLDVPSK